MSESIPMQTPLIDLLRGVPEALRGHWASQWNEDGLSTGHTVAPVGMYCHQAADRIASLEADNEALESLIKDIHDKLYDGEIYGWDDGSDEWQAMRVIARKSATEAPK
jgi:hypothetical protein